MIIIATMDTNKTAGKHVKENKICFIAIPCIPSSVKNSSTKDVDQKL
jgi:hypothetical protein